MLSPLLFNVYTSDQPLPEATSSYIYADDLCLTTQQKTFEQVETTLASGLNELGAYFKENHLRPNPAKTQLTAFHLKNRHADRKLNVTWNGTKLDHTNSPVYLGITLDRSLTYRNHCMKTRTKLSSRNNLLRKLHGMNWGACPHTMRTTAILRCLSVAEYCCPVWARSTHRKLVDTTLNETCRLITGCIRPTATPDLYVLSGIAPPEIRRSVHSQNERTKQLTDFLHVRLDEFVCKLYATRPAITSIDALWYNLFCARKGDAESHQLPPCQDCLKSIAYVPTIKLQCGEGA